jgi:hypothetical protein
MNALDLEGLHPVVRERTAPFAEEILRQNYANIHSIHLAGSSVTSDFDEKISDINTLLVLNEMDLGFIKTLAPLGKKYGKNRIAAPLIMTPEYINNSLDAFPIEFLDLKNIHKTIYGDDILKDIRIEKSHLRLQCEREIKTRLIGLRQAYLSSAGDKNILIERLSRSITGYIPLFRAIVFLMGKEPPIKKQDVISALHEASGINTDIFGKMLSLKRKEITISKEDADSSFEEYYKATETIGKIVDEINV